MEKKVILLTAGGTGGHFFPALALAEEFDLHKNIDVHLSTDERCRKYLTDEVKINFHIIDLYIGNRFCHPRPSPCHPGLKDPGSSFLLCRGSRILRSGMTKKLSGMTRGASGIMTRLFNKLKIPFSILLAVSKALLVIRKLKPSVIIGFGGYPSFPLMFVGQLLRIPTIIYEQNSFLGKSNKIFAKRAEIIALAYEDTKNLPSNCHRRITVTGDFVRNNIKNLKQKDKFDHKPFTLFVIGGSQGAKFFSELLTKAIIILVNKYPKLKLNVIQQVVKDDKEKVQKIYDELKVKNTIADFFHDIYKYYESCNLVIARSGATTIAELTQIGQPAIFIPLPSAADDHQYHNAKALADADSSWFYRQEAITPEMLADKLYELINDPSIIQEASLNLLKRKKQGTKNLVDTVLKIIA